MKYDILDEAHQVVDETGWLDADEEIRREIRAAVLLTQGEDREILKIEEEHIDGFPPDMRTFSVDSEHDVLGSRCFHVDWAFRYNETYLVLNTRDMINMKLSAILRKLKEDGRF